jgi:hypothetical protein
MRQRQKLAKEKLNQRILEDKKYAGSSTLLSDINLPSHSVVSSMSSNQNPLGVSSLITQTSVILPLNTSSEEFKASEIATVTEENVGVSAEVAQTEQIMQKCNKRLLADANDPYLDKRQRINSDKNIIARQGAVPVNFENDGGSQKLLIKFTIKKHPAEFVLSDISNGYMETTDDFNSAIVFDVKRFITGQLSIENCNLMPESIELIIMVPEDKGGPSTSFKLSDDQVSIALLSSILKEKKIPIILLYRLIITTK